MSVKVKKRFKNLGKTIGIGLFTLLMLTNIKLALLDDNEVSSEISILGIEVRLFEGTFANETSTCCEPNTGTTCTTVRKKYSNYTPC